MKAFCHIQGANLYLSIAALLFFWFLNWSLVWSNQDYSTCNFQNWSLSFNNKKDEFSPVHPVKVEEMVDYCLSEEMKIFLEIPLPDNLSLELVSDYVVNELYAKKSGLYSKAVVISAWPHVIFAIRQKDPRIVCGLIWSPKLLQQTFPR